MSDQLRLPGFPASDVIVNVASVPQRSPFRYPGGKTWLVPVIRQWLRAIPRPTVFVEPFAGGAIVGLTVAFENLADHVLLIELDEQVASVWKTVLSDDGFWLADRIASFELTLESVNELLSSTGLSDRELAFQTIVKNRVNRGGILAPGAGMLKYGEAGKGIRSRWYPETLKKRILAIAQIKERFTFIHGDGLEVIKRYGPRPRAAFLIDPPYTAAGKKAGHRLYAYSEINHERLFHLMASVKGEFLMTYDDTDHIRRLAMKFAFDLKQVRMKNTHHARMTELIIGRDLRRAF